MSKILITGGAGFIGSFTARNLVNQGHEVLVLDCFQQYIHPIKQTFIENVNYRYNYLLKDVRVIRANTVSKNSVRRILCEVNPDKIIHLAALPLANVALQETEEALETIVQGTFNILEVLRDHSNCQKFVYASSSMVYGDFLQDPMPENGKTEPKEIYGGMKLCGEILVKTFAKRYDIPCVIVRPSAVYGPTDNNRRVVQAFLENALTGKPVVVKNPEATRLDFTYVEDTAQGIALAVQSNFSNLEIFNITYGESHSLQEVVDFLVQKIPDIEIKQDNDTSNFRPIRGSLDITKAKEKLGFLPKVSLSDGLQLYLDHMLEHNPSLRRKVS